MSKKRILVIEDDLDIRDAIVQLLNDEGYETLEASNGAVALQILAEDAKFDLILSDLLMPVIGGAEFRTKQLADPKISQIPIVIMSADGSIAQKSKTLAASDYIRKPIDLGVFLDTIAKKFVN